MLKQAGRTGYRMKNEMTCIVCPVGCTITVEVDENNQVKTITGNTCNRGENYARNEVTHPLRQLTSTVKIDGALHKRLPVILSDNIPKEKVFDVMKEINRITIKAPVKYKDIIIENVCNLNVNVIASRTMQKKEEA